MKYYAGRSNLAATVFVPFKCGNNCKFCNTNILYKEYEFVQEYLEAILAAIGVCNNVDTITEFVITGGEPIMNLPVLKQIVDACDKPVFINTTLPKVDNLDEVIEYFNSEDKIQGINISRHIGNIHSIAVAERPIIDRIDKYVRINCIVDERFLNRDLLNYIDFWCTPHRMVNLRADYRTIGTSTLKNKDKVSSWLFDHFKFEGSNNCQVCNSEFFSDEDYKVICYHRGLEHSCVQTATRCYVNDIIIDMYGNIFKDWDMKPDAIFESLLLKGQLEH